MFHVQRRLRHPDAAVRAREIPWLCEMVWNAKHPAIHRQALRLLADQLGCDLVQPVSREWLSGVGRTSETAVRVGRTAVQ